MSESGGVDRALAIDPADQATWPADVLEEVERLALLCREQPSNGTETPSYELSLGHVDAGHEAEGAFRALLGTRPVALFHATRLLPHEREAIRSEGLLVLTDAHRSARLDRVIKLYGDELGRGQLEALRQAGPLSWNAGHRDGRVGRLFGITPLQAAFDDAGPGMTVFLDNWGGESFYWAAEDSATIEETLGILTQRSVPAVVEFAVEARSLNPYTYLWRVFVAQLRGWRAPWHEFCTTESIPPERVLTILGPRSHRWPLSEP